MKNFSIACIICILITGAGRSFALPAMTPVNSSSVMHQRDTSVTGITEKKEKESSWTDNFSIEALSKLSFKYALKLDLPVEELSNFQLLKFIDDWYGVKYRYGGDSKSGIDCSAFTRRLLNEVFCIYVGRVVPDQFQSGREIHRSELRMGDLVFFHTSNRRSNLSHVGFYLGNNRFVHATVSKGVMIDNLDNPYYRNAYRKSVRPFSFESGNNH